MSDGMAKHVVQALKIIKALGLPRAQQNERSALSLLALIDLTPKKKWCNASSRPIGITPIMEWMAEHYGKAYKPNTRETVRRQTMHQFVDAGIAIYNPDKPSRPVNSPDAVYQIAPEALELLKTFGSKAWAPQVVLFLSQKETLAHKYAMPRTFEQFPVRMKDGTTISLSPGKHSALIKKIVEEFGSRFVPDGVLVYAGDTGEKWGYFDDKLLSELGVKVNSHGKMPDAILYCPKRKWLILVEAVTSHGPVDGKRHAELARLFAGSKAGIVYVTAFPDRSIMGRYLGSIAWETEVWVADAPTHLIHFNGSRFLGPYI